MGDWRQTHETAVAFNVQEDDAAGMNTIPHNWALLITLGFAALMAAAMLVYALWG